MIMHTGRWGLHPIFDWYRESDWPDGMRNEWWVSAAGPTECNITTYPSRSRAVSDAKYQIECIAKYGVHAERSLFRFVNGIGFVKEELHETTHS